MGLRIYTLLEMDPFIPFYESWLDFLLKLEAGIAATQWRCQSQLFQLCFHLTNYNEQVWCLEMDRFLLMCSIPTTMYPANNVRYQMVHSRACLLGCGQTCCGNVQTCNAIAAHILSCFLCKPMASCFGLQETSWTAESPIS